MKEILLIMGYNAAGKTTITKSFINDGYFRINRDETGGSLNGISEYVNSSIKNGKDRIVLDNTYPSVKSRESIIKVGKDNNIPVRCIHLTTSFEDAQLNACLRMIQKTGKLFGSQDYKLNKNPNLFPPAALYHYRKEFQPPSSKEGFSKIENIPFLRKWDSEYKNKALILDYDGTLRLSTGKQKYPINVSDIQVLPGRSEKIKEYQKQGYLLLGASNQSGIAKESVSREAVVTCFEETNNKLELKIDYQFCPHNVPPITCYCRKPGCGIGAWFIEKYKLNPSLCIMVGDMTSDKTFAERCGFSFIQSDTFFK